MASIYDLKIFKLNRLKYEELWQDALKWVKKTYNASDEQFTMASPFAQLLSVILHMGRMVFYYIEDSITGLNIKTAYRPDQIRGLARLTGHDSTRPIAAKGAIRLTYYDQGNVDLNGKICYIPNKTTVTSTLNGTVYTILFGADSGKMTMQAGNYLDATIIQGTIKYQKGTGNGLPMQSFNFTERNYAEVENDFVNVYVNGEVWDIVPSILDMGYRQKACMVKSGQSGGIDIFFGNDDMGAIPPNGSTILVEYIVCDGSGGNLPKEYANSSDYWVLNGSGFLQDGTTINLNENFKVSAQTDVIFGSSSEDLTLTQMLAPHASRSFVLANETNYRYFFKKMNMFSHVEIIKGYTMKQANNIASIQFDQAYEEYQDILRQWKDAVGTYGESSDTAQELYESLMVAQQRKQQARLYMEDSDMADNTVYIMLIPNIKKRISSAANYFTCDENLFTLSEDEQNNILNLIDDSGQRIITVEHRMIEPKTPRFAVNAQVKIWEGYNIEMVYTNCLNLLSEYMLNFTRKDIIPISDIVALFESVDGVDSVKVWFDADVNNQEIYGNGNYGIDEYGDIVLTREITDISGNTRTVRDILPLLRGGFTSKDGVEYSDEQSNNFYSAFNLSLVSVTQNRNLSLENYAALT